MFEGEYLNGQIKPINFNFQFSSKMIPIWMPTKINN